MRRISEANQRYWFSWLASILFPTVLVAQGIRNPAGESQTPGTQVQNTLRPSGKRVVFESAPFATGSTVPYWDRGYLVSIVPEITSAGSPNVKFYNATGNKVREASVWYPGASAVYILSAAVNQQGGVLASGTAVKEDGTRAYFIAATDLSGRITATIQTNPFSAANVCETPDGAVWGFGDLGTEPNAQPTDGNLLRQYDFDRGLIKEFLPRSTFGTTAHSPAMRGNPGQEVYFRCLSNKLVIYSGIADQYVEFDTSTGSANRYVIDKSVTSLPVKGFAATEHSGVFGSLRDSSKPEAMQGLFQLEIDATTKLVRWVPVTGAVGKKGEPGVVGRLYGADGEYLVHNYEDDPSGRWAVSWSLPASRVGPR